MVVGVGVLEAVGLPVAVGEGPGVDVFVGVGEGPVVDVYVGVDVGVGVSVLVGFTGPTLIVPGCQEAGIAIPFWSDKIKPSGAAGVARVVTWEPPTALAREEIQSNVPLPCTGGRFSCAIA